MKLRLLGVPAWNSGYIAITEGTGHRHEVSFRGNFVFESLIITEQFSTFNYLGHLIVELCRFKITKIQ